MISLISVVNCFVIVIWCFVYIGSLAVSPPPPSSSDHFITLLNTLASVGLLIAFYCCHNRSLCHLFINAFSPLSCPISLFLALSFSSSLSCLQCLRNLALQLPLSAFSQCRSIQENVQFIRWICWCRWDDGQLLGGTVTHHVSYPFPCHSALMYYFFLFDFPWQIIDDASACN